MNVFLAYENNVSESVKVLDDVRLNKSIVETYQLLTLAIKEQEVGHEVKAGHYHHPVYLFYKNNPKFLTYYGYECCREYRYRFNKWHTLTDTFDRAMYYFGLFIVDEEGFIEAMEIPDYTPYYMEGSLGQPNYIRTTENVSELFKTKLIKKWEADKEKGRSPRWTKRQVPEFYKGYKGE